MRGIQVSDVEKFLEKLDKDHFISANDYQRLKRLCRRYREALGDIAENDQAFGRPFAIAREETIKEVLEVLRTMPEVERLETKNGPLEYYYTPHECADWIESKLNHPATPDSLSVEKKCIY